MQDKTKIDEDLKNKSTINLHGTAPCIMCKGNCFRNIFMQERRRIILYWLKYQNCFFLICLDWEVMCQTELEEECVSSTGILQSSLQSQLGETSYYIKM